MLKVEGMAKEVGDSSDKEDEVVKMRLVRECSGEEV